MNDFIHWNIDLIQYILMNSNIDWFPKQQLRWYGFGPTVNQINNCIMLMETIDI